MLVWLFSSARFFPALVVGMVTVCALFSCFWERIKPQMMFNMMTVMKIRLPSINDRCRHIHARRAVIKYSGKWLKHLLRPAKQHAHTQTHIHTHFMHKWHSIVLRAFRHSQPVNCPERAGSTPSKTFIRTPNKSDTSRAVVVYFWLKWALAYENCQYYSHPACSLF